MAAKDMARNELIVVQGHEHPLLLRRDLAAADLAWVAGEAPAGEGLSAKTRYRQSDAACGIRSLGGDRMVVDFPQAQWAVTPGQSVVLYRGEVCLGGGVIQ